MLGGSLGGRVKTFMLLQLQKLAEIIQSLQCIIAYEDSLKLKNLLKYSVFELKTNGVGSTHA